MSAPARKAVPLTRAKANRLRLKCLYNTQLPLHSPTESSRKALTTKPSLKTTPIAEAHSASLLRSAMAGLPSLPKVSVDKGTNACLCVCMCVGGRNMEYARKWGLNPFFWIRRESFVCKGESPLFWTRRLRLLFACVFACAWFRVCMSTWSVANSQHQGETEKLSIYKLTTHP